MSIVNRPPMEHIPLFKGTSQDTKELTLLDFLCKELE
ncbi:hypothetical protein CAEBREN_29489 [Caenorhabditis brenneri]|uniref:Uncharacterized protein n=1 Tax=Caenorhabditis brenneri TaxID=135651 RepID=G0P917_CAEBE|nr:hypothetical protein CAEBREN_29489 [Caenorhabditis brenneri]